MLSINKISKLFNKDVITMGFEKDSQPVEVQTGAQDRYVEGVLTNLHLLVNIDSKSTDLVKEVAEMLPTGSLLKPDSVLDSIESLNDEESWKALKYGVLIGIINNPDSMGGEFFEHRELIAFIKAQDNGFLGRQFESDDVTVRTEDSDGKGGANVDFKRLYGNGEIGKVRLHALCTKAVNQATSRITKQANRLLAVDPIAIEFREELAAKRSAERKARPPTLDSDRLRDCAAKMSDLVARFRKADAGSDTTSDTWDALEEMIANFDQIIENVNS